MRLRAPRLTRRGDPMGWPAAVAVLIAGSMVRRAGIAVAAPLLAAALVIAAPAVTLVAGEKARRTLLLAATLLSLVALLAIWPYHPLAYVAVVAWCTVIIGWTGVGSQARRQKVLARRARRVMNDPLNGWAQHVGMPDGTKVIGVTTTRQGRRLSIKVPPAAAHNVHGDRLRTAVAASQEVSRERVRVATDPENPAVLHADVLDDAPFATVTPGDSTPDDALVLGQYDTGEELRLTLDEHSASVLVAGMTGSGKTTTVRRIVHELARHDVEVWLLDPKGNQLGDLAPYASRWLRGDGDARQAMIEAEAAMQGRERNGWTRRLAIVVDELADVLDAKAPTAAHAKLVRRGRTAGIMLVSGMQSPHASNFGNGGARAQYPHIIAHCLRDTSEIGVALGPGAFGAGADCRSLPPGRAWVVWPGVRGYRQVQVWRAPAGRTNADLGQQAATATATRDVAASVAPAARALLAVLPGRCNEVAEASGRNRGSVSRDLRDLVDAGLAVRDGDVYRRAA